MFVSILISGWVKRRQSVAADPAGRLLGWMDDDPFSFCFGIEKDLGSALSTAGLAALVKPVRSCFDASAHSWRERRHAGSLRFSREP
jgi:hypothetical protein